MLFTESHWLFSQKKIHLKSLTEFWILFCSEYCSFGFFYSKMRNFTVVPNSHLFFYNVIQNFEICTQKAGKKLYEWSLFKTRRGIFCGGVWKERSFARRSSPRKSLPQGIVRTPLYKCRLVTSSRRLNNLVKYTVWKGSNELGWLIYQLISLNLGRGLSVFGWAFVTKVTHSFQTKFSDTMGLYWW